MTYTKSQLLEAADVDDLLTLVTSQRLSPSISLHTFSVSRYHKLLQSFRASQHIIVQLPPELDPIYGSRALSDEDRLLSFTPCQVRKSASTGEVLISFLASNGRVTGLLGLPRPQGPLTARLTDASGGFPLDVVKSPAKLTCVAGGTGLSPFLAMATAEAWKDRGGHSSARLLCSVNVNNVRVIQHLVESKILDIAAWADVQVFVTCGHGNGDDNWSLDSQVKALQESGNRQVHEHGTGRMDVRPGRMSEADIINTVTDSKRGVLFCGSKSLEWQVKMWLLDRVPVHVTEQK